MGAIRMTYATLRLLSVFLDEPCREHYGLELARSAGLKSGSLYPILARLEEAGWLTSEWEDLNESQAGRRRRRYYKLTADGQAGAAAAVAEAQSALSQRRPAWAVT